MLTSLRIKNFALVENAEVVFSQGLNVISGESGSGKSILIGALSVLLGDRNDKDCIRDGEKRCEIEATLVIPSELQKDIAAFLAEYDIEEFGNAFETVTGDMYVVATFTNLSGVEDADADVATVYATDGTIYVKGYEGDVKVVNISGQVVKDVVANGNTEISIAQGIYFVVSGNQVTKVVVK